MVAIKRRSFKMSPETTGCIRLLHTVYEKCCYICEIFDRKTQTSGCVRESALLSQLHTEVIVHLNVDSAVHMCLMDPLKMTFKSSLHTWMRWALFPVQHEGKDGFSQSATWPAGARIKYSSAPFTASWTLQETHKRETVRAAAWSHRISVHLCLIHYHPIMLP